MLSKICWLVFLLGGYLATVCQQAAGSEPKLLELVNRGSRVLFVGAHPDDETVAGPLLARAAETGKALVLCLTHGEGGRNRIGPQRGAELGKLRAAELRAACQILGADYQILDFWNGLPGGADNPANALETPQQAIARWRRQSRKDPEKEIVRVIRQWQPDIVLTFDPVQGFTGHKEHRAVGLLTRNAVVNAADPNAYPDLLDNGALKPHRIRRLYYVINPKPEKIHPRLPRIPPERITEIIDGNERSQSGKTYVDIALEAWSKHESQVGKDVLRTEFAGRMREVIAQTALVLVPVAAGEDRDRAHQ